MIANDINRMLIRHEGNRLKPYCDACGKFWRECTCSVKGKLTIGVGRNLDDVGISAQESSYLLSNDVGKVMAQCRQELPWFNDLCDARKMVIIDMVFNLGMRRFLEFQATITAIIAKDFRLAASHMLDSKWAEQVGYRAQEDAKAMEFGEFSHLVV